MELKENDIIEMSKNEYFQILLSLTHALNVSKAVSSVYENYFPTNFIDSEYINKIIEHYDNWIESSQTSSDDYTENIGQLLKDLNNEIRKNYYATINTITETYLQASHPNYEKMTELRNNMVDTWQQMAEIKTKEYFDKIDTVLGTKAKEN